MRNVVMGVGGGHRKHAEEAEEFERVERAAEARHKHLEVRRVAEEAEQTKDPQHAQRVKALVPKAELLEVPRQDGAQVDQIEGVGYKAEPGPLMEA